jgi:hypothetical protein
VVICRVAAKGVVVAKVAASRVPRMGVGAKGVATTRFATSQNYNNKSCITTKLQ